MMGPDGMSLVLLAFISVAYAVSIRRLERLRRALAAGELPNLLGVWTFAATLTLPPFLIAAAVAIAYLAEWPSRRIVGQGRPLRYAYSAGVAIASCIAASHLRQMVPGPIGILAAVVAFCLLNISLIAVAMVAAGHKTALRMFLNPKDHLVEVATQCLGVVLAELLFWHPPFAVLVVPAVLVVHRWSLRETVKVEKAFDEETGLWSETAWRVQAHQKLHDAHGHVALIIVDPDEPGTEQPILQAIGSGLTSSDLLGRYGTRQIVVLISVGRREAGPFLSTGFRADLARAGIPAALGCATTADAELEGLLIEAMSDLMARRAAAGVHRSW
jgi:hypothetical protein